MEPYLLTKAKIIIKIPMLPVGDRLAQGAKPGNSMWPNQLLTHILFWLRNCRGLIHWFFGVCYYLWKYQH